MNVTRDGLGSGLPAFLLGFGAGVALTLLLAPLSGEDTRRMIKGKVVKGGKAWVGAKATEAQGFVAAKGAALREGVTEVADVIMRARCQSPAGARQDEGNPAGKRGSLRLKGCK